MDISQSTFVLEEKVNDLENRLFHKSQVLKTKEHVLHLQQDQIKKLEDMYKKSLEEFAIVSGEHKKTLNDLENLRIILRSYENKKTCTNYAQTQVDLTPPVPEKSQSDSETTTEKQQTHFQKLRESIDLQNEKTDFIIDLLNNATTTQLANIRNHIEDLEKYTESLLTINSPSSQRQCVTYPIPEEPVRTSVANYKIYNLSSILNVLLENSSQTNLMTTDSWTNVPLSIATVGSQARVAISQIGTITELYALTSKAIQCFLQAYPSIGIQNTIYDEIYNLKNIMQTLVIETSISEDIYKRFQETLANSMKMADVLQETQEEVAELTQKCFLLDALIKRNSLLTTQEITELCRKITLQTSDNYKDILVENSDLKETIVMLRKEADNLKMHNSDISRLVVELSNSSMQTEECLFSVTTEDYRKQVVDLSDELANAYITITNLQNKLNLIERTSDSLEHLKDIFVKMSTENSQFYHSQVDEMETKYAERIRLFEEQMMDMQKVGDEDQRLSVLKMENSQLCKIIIDLKQELQLVEMSQNSADDLKLMCLKLGQQISDNSAIKQENLLLKSKINSCQMEEDIMHNHCNAEIQNLSAEIRKLNAENQELSEGVNQLKLIVQLNSDMETSSEFSPANKPRGMDMITETDSCQDSESITSNELVPRSSQVQLNPFRGNETPQSIDIEEMIRLCESISQRLTGKNINSANDKSTLATLEQDIRNLTKEFMDLKWYSQNEHQKMVQKHADLIAHNEELVACLNQYKKVNENLLQSHYELEKSKNLSATHHQDLLEDYLKLQDKLQKVPKASDKKMERGDCTVLSLRDLRNLDHLKVENLDLQNLNLKLRQEIQNLLMQLHSDQQLISLQKSKTSEKKAACRKCDQLISENLQLKSIILQKEEDLTLSRKSLQHESSLFSQINDELHNIKNLHGQCENQNDQLHKAFTQLQNDFNSISEEKENLLKDLMQFETQSSHLISELSKTQEDLTIVQEEKKSYMKELEHIREDMQITAASNLVTERSKSQKYLKLLTDEKEDLLRSMERLQKNLKESEENYRNAECALKRSQDEVNMLHKMINKMTTYKDKYNKLETEITELRSELLQKNMLIKYNESLQEDYQLLVDQLKAVTEGKEKVELDFESYIRTNNLLQATMNTQNCNLTEELKLFQKECDRLRRELSQSENSNPASKSDFLRVVNECDNYKNQLENMAKRIDCHLREHVEYRTEMEELRKRLETENSSLKKLLKTHNMPTDQFSAKNYQGENGVVDLETFINSKEMEIDFLMGQKLEAMEIMGHLVGGASSNKRCRKSSDTDYVTSESGEEFNVQLNFKKACKETSTDTNTKPAPKPNRSSSVPRTAKKNVWDKDQHKLGPPIQMNKRTSPMRKTISNLPIKKK